MREFVRKIFAETIMIDNNEIDYRVVPLVEDSLLLTLK